MHNQWGYVITGKKNEVAPISFGNTLEREQNTSVEEEEEKSLFIRLRKW